MHLKIILIFTAFENVHSLFLKTYLLGVWSHHFKSFENVHFLFLDTYLLEVGSYHFISFENVHFLYLKMYLLKVWSYHFKAFEKGHFQYLKMYILELYSYPLARGFSIRILLFGQMELYLPKPVSCPPSLGNHQRSRAGIRTTKVCIIIK